MMKFLLVFCVFFIGCVSNAPTEPTLISITATDQPIKIDGILDEPHWVTAEVCNLSLSRDKNVPLTDKGQVKFLLDDNNLYIAITFNDGDIVAEGSSDNELHYRMGDVCEIFLKPPGQNYYWEIYATPKGNKSFFFIPGRGRLAVPSCFEGFPNDMIFSSEILGTLNDFSDEDKKWVCEIAIPREFEMQHLGLENVKIEPDWKMLVARYNYSVYLENKELSMYPQLKETNFHAYQEYGLIKFSH